jgi:hypothetical protein
MLLTRNSINCGPLLTAYNPQITVQFDKANEEAQTAFATWLRELVEYR